MDHLRGGLTFKNCDQIHAKQTIGKELCLLYRQVKVHTKLHPGLEWRIFHILTSEDIDDVISHSYTVVCAKILLYI